MNSYLSIRVFTPIFCTFHIYCQRPLMPITRSSRSSLFSYPKEVLSVPVVLVSTAMLCECSVILLRKSLTLPVLPLLPLGCMSLLLISRSSLFSYPKEVLSVPVVLVSTAMLCECSVILLRKSLTLPVLPLLPLGCMSLLLIIGIANLVPVGR